MIPTSASEIMSSQPDVSEKTLFVLPFFLLLPFGVKMPNVWTDYLLFSVSGLCFAFGLWTLYIAIQKSEISHVGPLVGAAAVSLRARGVDIGIA